MAKIAGKVAFTLGGDYSSTATYEKLVVVRYNGKAYAAKKASKGILPTNTEYWMLLTDDGITTDTALSDTSTNPVQNKVVKTALDQIQTTSSGTLSEAGWYRVASVKGNPTTRFKMMISKPYWGNGSEIHILNCVFGNTTRSIGQEFSNTNASQVITKARITNDGENNHIEIYYHSNNFNPISCCITDIVTSSGYFQAITPTLTAETVDGVIVTTTYDIPSNASPVTDLDLKRFEGELLSTSAFEKALEVGDGIWNYRLNTNASAVFADEFPEGYNYSTVLTIAKNVNYTCMVNWGRQQSSKVKVPIINYFYNGTWSGWQTFATTSDLATELAEYVPLSGGVAKEFSVSTTANTGLPTVTFRNSSGVVRQYLSYNANIGMFERYDTDLKVKKMLDSGNFSNYALGKDDAAKYLSVSDNNSINFAGITDSEDVVFNYRDHDKNTNAGNAKPIQRYSFYDKNGEDGNCVVLHMNEGSGARKILHTGNSVSTQMSSTAPQDTSVLWYDTINKMLKRYVDGAWQQ